MKIVVDRSLCQTHGVCAAEAPEVFKLEGDELVVLLDEPPESMRAEVKAAAKYCPTKAIRVEE